MDFWLNHFIEFERKRKRANRLVLNFSHVHGGLQDGNLVNLGKVSDRIKVYVPVNVRVPTWFLTPTMAEEITRGVKEDPVLESLLVERKRAGRFEVLEVEVQNSPDLLGKLRKLGFRTLDCCKMLKYRGFYPERKVVLEDRLLSDIGEKDEIELPDLNSIRFGDFLTLEEARKLPYVLIDIEKPLWRRPREKELYNLRKKLLAVKEDKKTKQINRIVKKIEERLSWLDPEVENANLYDDAFNADISYVGTTWVIGDERIKELYIIDSRGEVDAEECKGFKILKFRSEIELLKSLRSAFRERKPLVAIGHNQIYDYSQIRFASDDNDLVFDPAVKDVRLRRDFVRSYSQRPREDLIYIDTMWFGKIKHPYLNQSRFGTSFKLEALATHLKVDFKKSLTHEQLREVEFRRLAGSTLEIRKRAASQMIEYTISDIGVTEEIFHILDPWPVLVAMKKPLPFCTYTEVAFSPNIMGRLHEYNHFSNAGNLLHSGFKRGQKQTELQIFKKEFPGLKEAHLKMAGLEKAPKGNYENVSEYYVSVESWLLDLAFSINPELREAHSVLKDTDEFAFLQYLRAYMMQVFSDYFHTNTSEDQDAKNISEERDASTIFEEKEASRRRFYARYGFDTKKLRKKIREGYRNLAMDINENGMRYIDHLGDYVFVQGHGEIRGARKIRTLETFERK